MTRMFCILLTLLVSLSGLAMGGYSDFGRWSLAAEGTTTLWRSVSAAELRDVGANGLRQSAGSMGNKWFAESAADAAAWGKKFYAFDKEPVFTLRVEVPDSVANQMLRMDRLDGIGPARSADGSLLQMINEQGTIKVLNGNVLPK